MSGFPDRQRRARAEGRLLGIGWAMESKVRALGRSKAVCTHWAFRPDFGLYRRDADGTGD